MNELWGLGKEPDKMGKCGQDDIWCRGYRWSGCHRASRVDSIWRMDVLFFVHCSGPSFLVQKMVFHMEKNWAPVKEIIAYLLQLLCNHCPLLRFQLIFMPRNNLSGHLVLSHTGSRCWPVHMVPEVPGPGVHMKQKYIQSPISQEHWHIAFQAWRLRRPHYSKIWNEE